jgi:NAD(P) transhydrogenase subunit alpha
MKPGSVVVDMAAEQGGNCEYTKPGEVNVVHGVSVIGYTDLPSRMAHVASDFYGMNLLHFLDEMGGASGWKVDHDNDAVRPALVLEGGELRWPPPPPKAQPAAAAPAPTPVKAEAPVPKPLPAAPAPAKSHGHGPPVSAPSKASGVAMAVLGVIAAIVWIALRFSSPDAMGSAESTELIQRFTVFVMAIFIGFQVVWNVTPALHTPLMSVTNAISGIIVVGGLLAGSGDLNKSVIVAVIATMFATINIAGGFIVTRRMLAMFRK